MTPTYTEFSGRSVLITGGLGFIGSNLARRLVEIGADVTLLDSLIPEYGGNLHNIRDIESQVKINVSDMRDIYSLRYMVSRAEIIFNLAGQTSHMDSMSSPLVDLEINCASQLAFLEACRTHRPDAKIVFASTRQIYGRPEYLPVDERHPIRPTDVNGINKHAGESYHLLYNAVHGLRSTALRLTNTYGPGMRVKDARQTFLGIWIRMAVEGAAFEIWGGDQLRDFSYIDDTVEALLQAAGHEVDGSVFNISGDSVVSLLQAGNMLSDISGVEFVVRDFPPERKKIDIGDYYADDTAFRNTVGWRPRVSLRSGLEKTFSYYQSALEHYL